MVGKYEVSWVLCVRSPSVFAYYSDYIFCSLISKYSIVWQATLVKYIIFSFIPSLATARNAPTEKRRHYDRVLNSAETGVLVPLQSHFVVAITEVSSFHTVPLSSFDAAPVVVVFLHTCKIDWLSVPRSRHSPVFPYQWRRTTVNDDLVVGGV